MPKHSSTVLLILALAAFGVACGGGGPEEDEAKAAAIEKELGENVERSTRTLEETYDAARKSGESAVDAGGEAYNAVQDLSEEEKKKASP